MWRNSRDRADDPRTLARETERLARDEYDRPRYGSEPNAYGERSNMPGWNNSQRPREPERGFQRPNHAGKSYPGVQAQADSPLHGVAGRPYSVDQRPFSARPHLNDIRVHELMSRRVTSVHPGTSVERAVRLMEECNCGALPVVGDNGVLVGMVTDRDIAIRIVGRGRDARIAIVADCMTERVFACYANESVAECMRQMARHQVRRMPIVDDRGRLVGILAQGDLARHAGRHPVREERRALTEVVCAVSEPSDMPYR
jgi:CBS domain-containing protein